MRRSILLLVAMGLLTAPFAHAKTTTKSPSPAYLRAIERTAAMVGDPEAQSLAAKHGLQVLDLTWEDTARFEGSSVGPNISDMTIQVVTKESSRLMPVIRYDNFTDKTADVSADDFYLLVGNERGEPLRKVTLKHFLEDVPSFLHDPTEWKAKKRSLLAKRDSHVLVSAQACFLPVPKEGIAEFNPVLFNYQSVQGDPAVLTILATRQGTSVTVIDNVRDSYDDGYSWGQRLFFNDKGERASFTGQRMSDFVASTSSGGGESVKAAGQEGLNMVLLIQVPLKQKVRPWPKAMFLGAGEMESIGVAQDAPSAARGRSDVEAAVIGHGEADGEFTEIGGLEIERDERYPIRVTVQFYKATSNGVVSPGDMKEIAAQIERVYERADYVGSLVVDGPRGRPTEYEGDKVEPPEWWSVFWARHEANTGMTKEETLAMLRALHGPSWRAPYDRHLLQTSIREATTRPR